MKIRCEHNSIRFRLRKSELAQLRTERWIETAVHFPDGQVFAWELLVSAEASEMNARFSNGRLSLSVPETQALAWMDSDTVGMEQFTALPDGGSLHLLVEKDFPCKDRPHEDPSDFFSELAEEAPVKC